jgi:hypothetical protein
MYVADMFQLWELLPIALFVFFTNLSLTTASKLQHDLLCSISLLTCQAIALQNPISNSEQD